MNEDGWMDGWIDFHLVMSKLRTTKAARDGEAVANFLACTTRADTVPGDGSLVEALSAVTSLPILLWDGEDEGRKEIITRANKCRQREVERMDGKLLRVSEQALKGPTLIALPRERPDLAMGLADTPRAGCLMFLLLSPILMLDGANASAMARKPAKTTAVRMVVAGNDA